MMDKETFGRAIEEFNTLNDRATKLRTFLTDEEKTKEVDNLNKDLLIAQLKAMEAYLSVLSIRIGLNAPREAIADAQAAAEGTDSAKPSEEASTESAGE